MINEESEADLRAAVDERLKARIAEAARRRDRRRRQLAELSERRDAGLRARHAQKLARLKKAGEESPDAEEEADA